MPCPKLKYSKLQPGPCWRPIPVAVRSREAVREDVSVASHRQEGEDGPARVVDAHRVDRGGNPIRQAAVLLVRILFWQLVRRPPIKRPRRSRIPVTPIHAQSIHITVILQSYYSHITVMHTPAASTLAGTPPGVRRAAS